MKTIYNRLINLFIPLFLAACSSGGDDEVIVPEEPKAKLSISTTIQTRAVTTAFSSGDKMNVYVKTGSGITSTDYKAGISASYNGSLWTLSPEVELQGEAYVFASYPYIVSANANSVDVSVSPQTDYLYSGNGVKVSGSSSTASLTMKHALPMIAFNIAKGNYIGEGKLSSIEVTGENLYKTGTMNVANGEITGKDKGSYTIATSYTIVADGWKENLPQMFCLPFNSNGDNVEVTITIDGTKKKTVLPTQNIVGGMKYLFRLVLTQDEIIMLSDQTEVISLNKNTDEMSGGAVNELSILYKGTKAVIPELTGSGKVTGTVIWGDGTQEPYSASLTHTYSKEGNYQVRMQSVGATAVEFKDLEEVEEINLSGF